MQILIAILIFSLIVIVHEFGHFLFAKINKIGVIEFSLGMGPRIFTWVKTKKGIKFRLFSGTKKLEEEESFKGRTWYSLKVFPIGGSCIMLGEEEAVESENAFNKKSVYARMSVIIGGPLFNFILAFIFAMIIVSTTGYDKPSISAVEQGQPMQQAGFQAGDVITGINDTNIVINREIGTYLYLNKMDGSPVQITVDREGTEISKSVTPIKVKRSDGKEAYQLGFQYSFDREKVGILGTLKYSAYELKYWVWTTVQSLREMVMGRVTKDDISGPIGIVKIVGDSVGESMEYTKTEGISVVMLTIMNLCILLTANLGVMNLLPIPALDGGRLVLLIIEWIRRKPNNQKVEGYINLAGFVALMLLMVLIVFNDISKIWGW